MPETTVSEHLRRVSSGRVGNVRRHQRRLDPAHYLPRHHTEED